MARARARNDDAVCVGWKRKLMGERKGISYFEIIRPLSTKWRVFSSDAPLRRPDFYASARVPFFFYPRFLKLLLCVSRGMVGGEKRDDEKNKNNDVERVKERENKKYIHVFNCVHR